MMRSHGWDRDLPSKTQKQLREKYNVEDFDSLYNFYLPGFNLRSTDLQAFIGLNAINKLDSIKEKRNNNFNYYIENIKINELNIEIRKNDFISNFAMPIVSKNKKKLVEKLKSNNIECRPLIAGNMANKPFWYETNEKPILKNCEYIDQYGFYIPNHQNLTNNDLKIIIDTING
jgi:CDP-6-deoxy-D-xylo-4-hexulose-3-dehydrase